MNGGLVGVVIGFIFIFYVVSSTYPVLESSGLDLQYELENATLDNVSDLSDLPAVAILLFILATIFGIIIYSTRSGGI